MNKDSNSRWGNSRDNQTKAYVNGDWMKTVEVPERLVFGIFKRKSYTKQERVHSSDREPVPDEIEAYRTFKHRCALIKAVNVLSGSNSTLTLYLEGFSNMNMSIQGTSFVFDSEIGDTPVVDITFSGHCTRYGKMKHGYRDEFVSLIFRDKDQMKDFVVATTTAPDPERISSIRSSSGYHRSNEGSSLWPLAAGMAIGFTLGD